MNRQYRKNNNAMRNTVQLF